MKIGIDIDDTLVNTRELQKVFWKEFVRNNPTDEFTEELPAEINKFGNDYISLFWDTYRERLLFPEFKENVSVATKMLKDLGCELYIVTARPPEKYHNLKERLSEWFNNNDVILDDLYLGINNKGEFIRDNKFDYLIDDGLHHVNETLELGGKAILFNNIEEYEGLQANNWLDVVEIIKKDSH